MLDDIAKNIFGASKKVLKGDPKKRAELSNKIKSTLFEDVKPGDADTIGQKVFGVKMTKPAAIVGSLGVAAYMTSSAFDGMTRKRDMGDIGAGSVANTIGSGTSYGLENASRMIEENPDLADKFARENLSDTQSGVDAEIVFAMHQLRNG